MWKSVITGDKTTSLIAGSEIVPLLREQTPCNGRIQCMLLQGELNKPEYMPLQVS